MFMHMHLSLFADRCLTQSYTHATIKQGNHAICQKASTTLANIRPQRDSAAELCERMSGSTKEVPCISLFMHTCSLRALHWSLRRAFPKLMQMHLSLFLFLSVSLSLPVSLSLSLNIDIYKAHLHTCLPLVFLCVPLVFLKFDVVFL